MTSMKTGLKATLVMGALLLASAGTAAAQDAVAGSDVGATPAAGATRLIDPAEVAAQLRRADELMSGGQLAEARALLVSLADEQKVSSLSAAETYLKLAAVENGEGRAQAAAAALDDAAAEAQQYKQPALEARALLDAASVYAATRQHSKAQARLSRVSSLAGSPEISAELRAEIQARVRR
jgi:hypothetical protein